MTYLTVINDIPFPFFKFLLGIKKVNVYFDYLKKVIATSLYLNCNKSLNLYLPLSSLIPHL